MEIDHGRPYDWNKTSADYAAYRDIYPPVFYEKIIEKNLCVKGQRALDLGTGTGVLPRNLYAYGACWTGVDSAASQIAEAKRLAAAQGMEIEFQVCAAESLPFPPDTFDVVTACQCHWYFDYETLAPALYDVLKPGGAWLVLCMEWLPFEDPIAGASEALVLQYNPAWTGAGETRRPIVLPEVVNRYFTPASQTVYDVRVPFTRETWHGRMKACRGIGASLDAEALAAWEAEHRALLERIAPPSFDVLHFAAMTVLRVKK